MSDLDERVESLAGTIVNDHGPTLSAADEQGLAAQRDLRTQELAEEQRIQEAARPTSAATARLHERVAEWGKAAIPGLADDLEAMQTEQRATLEQRQGAWPEVPSAAPGPVHGPAGYGEFWFAQERWSWPVNTMGATGLNDGVHVYGRVDYKRDPLWTASVNVNGDYALSPDRLPPSPSGRYRSLPHAFLYGTIAGWQGLYEIPWHMDDKWCNCSLTLYQKIYQNIPGAPQKVLGAGLWSNRFIHMENHYGVDQQSKTFTGIQYFPSVDFSGVVAGLPIWAYVEVRFDMALEGDASLSFSPGPNPTNSVVVALDQWHIQTL